MFFQNFESFLLRIFTTVFEIISISQNYITQQFQIFRVVIVQNVLLNTYFVFFVYQVNVKIETGFSLTRAKLE